MNKQPLWQPSCDLSMLQTRATLLENIRDFFKQRQILEVQTPILARSAIPEAHINLFKSQYRSTENLYLQASPEAMMKRLLAAGAGSIYQISTVFRDAEQGRWHNPEFSLLEWYRLDFDHHDLMREVATFLKQILGQDLSVHYYSYQALFLKYIAIDPLQSSVEILRQIIKQRCPVLSGIDSCTQDTCLQYLLSELIEPELAQQQIVFVYDYPASQASLARLDPNNKAIASRFEVYINGIELANGFHELNDADEQAQRFEQQQLQKQQLGDTLAPSNQHLLTALAAGLPDCAGVAIGIDRLLMLKTKTNDIKKVCSFAIDSV